MSIKALIFDMDGLMIDTERLYFETDREIAAQYGKTVEDSFLWGLMGRSPMDASARITQGLKLPLTAEEYLQQSEKMMLRKINEDLLPMPGLDSILTRFSEKLDLSIATGSKKWFLNVALDKLNIRGHFKILQTSDDIENGKPHPEIYLKTAARLGYRPDECVVLEDSSNGSLAGKNAGCHVISVPSDYTREQDFSFTDYIAKDLFDAARYIEKLLIEEPVA